MTDKATAAKQRIARTQELMAKSGVDLLVLGPSADFFYLTGRWLMPTERLTALMLPKHGPATIVVPAIAAPLLEDLRPTFDVVTLAENDSPTTRVANTARAHGAETLAVNDDLWSGFLLDIQQALPSARYSRASAVLSEARVTKDTGELAALRRAAGRIDAVWKDFCDSSTLVGQTERAVRERLRELIGAYGMEFVWCDVGAGPNSASALHVGGDRVIEAGDPLLIDYGGTLEGYFGDTCHTVLAGKLNREFAEIYEIVREAQAQGVRAAQVGRTCEAVDHAARSVIADRGYGKFFVHRLGHGIGLAVHEDPYLIAGNRQELQSGMAFSVEPGIYIPGKWGVRIEDIVAIEAGVSKPLNNVAHDLRVLP